MIDPESTRRTDLKDILGTSHQTISRLVTLGVLKPVGPGKFDLAQSVQAYVLYRERGRATSEQADARSSVAAQQERRLRLENDRTEGKLIDVAEVQAVTDAIATTFRGSLEGLPGRVGTELASIGDPAVVKERLRSEVHRILTEVADRLEHVAAGAGGSA